MGAEILKTVVVNGENFTIKKFPAVTGLQIAKFLIGKMSGIIPMLKDESTNDEQISAMLAMVNDISDKELTDFIHKCLKQCYKPLPAGLQPVMDAAGNYGIEDIEYDMVKTVYLCIEAVKWGAADFFGEKGSGLMLGLTALTGLSLNQ